MTKLNKLFKNRFVKNIAMVANGTAFAQTLTIILSPIVTRIYPPEQYGVLTVYTSLLTLLTIGASLDYQKAIPIAKKNQDAYNLIVGSFLVLVTFVMLLILIMFFWGEELFSLLKSETLIDYKFLVPVGILCVGTYNILLQWSLRERDFKTVTITKYTQSILSNTSRIGLGLTGIGPIGLLISQIIGQGGGIIRLSNPLRRMEFKQSIKCLKITSLFKRYIKFPLYSAPSNYVYTAGSQAPIIVITSFFGTAAAGLYGLANTIVNLPVSLLAASVSQVFYAEIANIGKENPKKIKILLFKLSSRLALIALFPLLIFIIIGPWLFSFVFGANWYDAGVYARVLGFVAFAHFVILPAGRVLEVLEMQNIGLVVNIFRLFIIILAFIVAGFLNLTALQTVILYTIVTSLSYFILYMIVQRVLTKQVKINNAR